MNYLACIFVAAAFLVAIFEMPFAIEANNAADIELMLDIYNDARHQRNVSKVEASDCATSLASDASFVFDYAQPDKLVSGGEMNRSAKIYCGYGNAEYSLFITRHADSQKNQFKTLIQSGKLNDTLSDATKKVGFTQIPWKSMDDDKDSRIWAVVFVKAISKTG
ncbi:hypothetical protein BDF19DRAFT_445514 [Syncephalis fuscata]|nr:hypothetical protein BDF19DRAFT_445514 [Syncephalis fuscata]